MILKKEVAGNPSNLGFDNINQAARRAVRLFVVLSAGIIIFISAIETARAATFTVTKTANTFDGACDADCSLRDAIIAAGNVSSDDVIAFAPSLFSTPQTIFVNPGGIGGGTGNGTLTFNGPGANLLSISCNNQNPCRIFLMTGGTVTFNNLTLTGGNMISQQLAGGAIANDTGTLFINNCIITGNSGDPGGAISTTGTGGRTTISNSTITNNRAPALGGAVYVGFNATININNSTLSGNALTPGHPDGGGGAIFNNGTLNLTNTTISGNAAGAGAGGAIRNIGTANLVNVTIAENSAGTFGGGIFNSTGTGIAVNARNTIIANNTASSAPDFANRLESQGYNLIENTSGTIMMGTTTGNITGQDPLLGPLANNGGATLTHALLVGSPAIDAANPSNFPLTDQRGLSRPADGDGNGSRLPDIGAFERNAVAPYRNFDFDGDARADVSVYRPNGGFWYLLQSTAGFAGVQFGISTDLIVPADYDGDRKTDIAVFRPADGVWYLLQSNDGFAPIQFGQNGDIPVPGDYDGNGRANLAVFRPSTGSWYIARATGVPSQNFDTVPFGLSTDLPTTGDFDGDGKSDVAVYRPSNGFWYRLNSSNGQFVATQFGISTDKIVPADYDGDGKTDLGVFRPADGAWYLLQSTGGFVPVPFGQNGDVPVPAD